MVTNQNKTVLLTGGSGSIGRSYIADLNAAEYNVYFTSRSEDTICEIESSYSNSEKFVKGITIDFSTADYIKVLDDYFLKQSVRPSILINNMRDIENLKVRHNGVTDTVFFMREIELNVVVPYQLTMFLAINQGYSLNNVINISSIYGVVPPNKSLYEDGYQNSPIQYGVTKAALIHLTKELAVRLADKGVRVNCISYGGVEGRVDENFKKRYAKLVPNGNMLKKAEVGGPLLFLASEASSGMTGQNIIYDGGYTIW